MTQSSKRRLRRYDAKQRAEVLGTARACGVVEARRRHGVPKGTLYKWVAQAYEEEGAERWPLYRRYEVVEWSTEEGASARAEAGREPASRAEPPQTACASAGVPDAVDAPGELEQALMDAHEAVVKDSGASTAMSGSGASAARSSTSTSISDDRLVIRRRVGKRYTPSQRAEALAYAAAHGVSAAAKKLGMSRPMVYAWRKQQERARAGLGPSPTEGEASADIEAQRDREILAEWRRQPGLGPSQIQKQLRRRQIKVSVNTVRDVMIEAGYRPPRMKTRGHDERFEALRPNQLWHLDFVHRYINRAKVYTLILQDDCSRYVPGWAVAEGEQADAVIESFEAATERHGRPEMVLHDQGSAFWAWRGISRFTTLLTEMGIEQIAAPHKEWNGKVERLNATLHKELFDVRHFDSVSEMKRGLAEYLHWYNHQRTHQALAGGLLVPADRYFGRHAEVLARIQAGLAQDDSDPLGLRGRDTTLFQAVNKDGALEVWFLGQRLLSLPRP
jgi:putative transposase